MKHPQISSIQCSSTNSQGAPRHRLLWTMIVALLSAFALDHREPQLQAAELPAVSDKAPIPGPHFPNSVYAVVFRNWGLATPERLAKVLKTTPEKVTAIATSMGLPKIMPVPAQMDERGYVTLIRRNWHLLPFDQMVTLLNIAAEELELRLREDDFLWIKLGRLKPNSPPVVYREPDAAAKKRAAEIKSLIHKHFGDKLAQPGEERFKFVTDLSRVDPKPEPKKSNDNQPAAKTAAKDEPPRIVYSYFALFGDPLSNPKVDPFPDGLLQKLQARGVNGVWLHVVLRQLVTGGKTFPEFGEGHEARLENLRKLVERADKFGIKIYLYINEPRAMPVEFFKNRPEMAGTPDREQPGYQAMCTSHPAVRQWLTDGMAYLFEKVPGLGGVITITASENLTNCYSRLSQEDCPHCRERAIGDILLEVNKAIAEGVHRSAPDAKVFVWDWAWFRHGDASETIAKLPKSVWLMSVSEWKLPIEHQGIKGLVGEYAMSLVGPGPRALQHWKVAKEHGLKIAAKTQYNCTWEIAALPFIPVMDLVAQHNVNLASEGLDGQMMSWSLGGYPSLNLELARRISEQKKPDGDAALQSLAEDAFGKQAAPLIRKAWTQFSAAFREYPYNSSGLYAGAQHMGPANLLYGKPTGYGATMVGFPYDDVVSWCGHYPDVIYLSQMQKLSEGWAKGMESFEKAVALADPDKKEEAQRELSVAKALGLHWASVANQTQFAMDRNAVARSNNPADQEHLKQRMRSTIDSEIALAKQMYDVSKADSRVGFEATMHYYYVPLDLVEKVINCEHVIAELK